MLTTLRRSKPLASIRQVVRMAGDRWHESPQPWFTPREVRRGAWSSGAMVEALRREGICIVAGALEEPRLGWYREAFARLLAEPKLGAPHPAASRGQYGVVLDLAVEPGFTDLLLDEMILAAVEQYYQRPVFLSVGQAVRLDPVEPSPALKGWHHDSKGKYVKAMWLLTDTPADGQRMSYLAGTHRARHVWATYEQTRFTEEEARRQGQRLVECAGPAGTVILFDTNGVHRPNRNLGPRRDTLVAAYSTGRFLHGCRFDPAQVSHLTRWQRAILQRSRHTSPGYGGPPDD